MDEAVLKLAVIGAGPVGLALALHAARMLPQCRVSLFDARPIELIEGRRMVSKADDWWTAWRQFWPMY